MSKNVRMNCSLLIRWQGEEDEERHQVEPAMKVVVHGSALGSNSRASHLYDACPTTAGTQLSKGRALGAPGRPVQH